VSSDDEEEGGGSEEEEEEEGEEGEEEEDQPLNEQEVELFRLKMACMKDEDALRWYLRYLLTCVHDEGHQQVCCDSCLAAWQLPWAAGLAAAASLMLYAPQQRQQRRRRRRQG
jgi:hypothetical protein